MAYDQCVVYLSVRIMKNSLDKSFLSVLFILLTCGFVQAQEVTYQFEKVEVSITGTSTLHDWTVTASEVIDHPTDLALTEAGGEISDFSFQVSVASMDGGRGPSMNDKIKKALQADEHPYVSFRQTAASVLDLATESFQAEGELTMAGITKPYSIQVQTDLDADRLEFTGQQSLLLSDFGIDAPSAMFGQIQTGDEVVVHFTYTYKRP